MRQVAGGGRALLLSSRRPHTAGVAAQELTACCAHLLGDNLRAVLRQVPLHAWTADRFGDWPFPKLFLSARAYTGCRLMDLCSLRSAQLQTLKGKGRLVFPADLTKGQKERAVPLPDVLFAALDAFKGEMWLWENYLPGLKAALAAKGWPTHQIVMEFGPVRLYSWVETLFADYNRSRPGLPTLTTHMFRSGPSRWPGRRAWTPGGRASPTAATCTR